MRKIGATLKISLMIHLMLNIFLLGLSLMYNESKPEFMVMLFVAMIGSLSSFFMFSIKKQRCLFITALASAILLTAMILLSIAPYGIYQALVCCIAIMVFYRVCQYA